MGRGLRFPRGSAFQQRFDPFVEFLERRPAHDLLAIDEKGRLAVDPEISRRRPAAMKSLSFSTAT
jgi:hypothetical protein